MRPRRIVLIGSLLALGLTLAGCESFDPTDWFNTKKPLPGERRDVFPGGVPGVPQGVPAELVEGNKQQAEPPPEVVEEKPKPKPKAKPRPQQAASPPRQPRTRVTTGAPQQPPAAGQAWPDPQQSAGQPAPAQAPAAFPDPPRR
jgi:hypothetical protein